MTVVHLRRIIDNVGGGHATISRRRLHGTQYGCVCPVETPEGHSVGLNKGLAIISHITFDCPTKPIINFCINNGTEMLDEFIPTEITNLCKIFVNGNWIGCHRNPEKLVSIFRLYRRNGLINIFTSIAWELSNNEVKIYTDGGRIVRPLYIIENNNILIQPHHIKEIQNNNITFTDLLSGFNKRKTEYNYYESNVKDLSILGLDNKDPLYIDKLREKQAVIEYIDSQEFNTTYLSIGFNILPNSLQRFTHVELHPSMILSFNAHLLPFIQYNFGPRAIFSSKHVKQGITTYAMNFNNRIDTSSIILNNPEQPLTVCKLNKAFNGDKFGQGHNLFVAICKYNYNQDDAIVGNQSTLDLGLFGTSYYKMYSANEMIDPKTGEETHFYNPLYKDEMPDYPDIVPSSKLNYNKMDKYGLPKKGAFIEKNDIVIGKYMKNKDDKGNDDYRDMSSGVKLGNEGSCIDHVYTCQTNEDGDRMVKVRTCQFRKPIMGDKFASRNGQKGTFGLVMKKEDLPYTEDGITPDIILDPSSYPTRMTVTQFIEILFGNMAAELGFQGCYNAFETINIEQINDILETQMGFTSMGNRILYNGITGEQMEVTVFTGMVYYQRLKYMVNDKINTRTSGHRDENGIPIPGGAYTVKERQSVAGRANGGGLKFGEMERDALLTHGIWGFIKESYVERCDKFIINVSKTSGEISISNPETNLYYDNLTDGQASYHLTDVVGNKNSININNIIGLNLYDQKTMDCIKLVVPYTFKIFLQEMQGMCMNVRLNVDIMRDLISQCNSNDDLVELSESQIDDMMSGDYYKDDENDDEDIENEDIQSGGDNSDSENSENSEGMGSEDEDTENIDENSEIDSEEDGGEDGGEDGEENDSDEENGEIMNTQSGGNVNMNNMNNMNMNNMNMNNMNMNMNMNNTNMNNMNMNNTNTNMMDNFQRANLNPDIVNTNYDNDNTKELSQYGGIKPEFHIKENDDEKVIEDLNANLLGLQNAGTRDKLEVAKTQGINNVLNNNNINSNNTNQPYMQNQQGGGLNMSFNNQHPIVQQQNQQFQQIQKPVMQQQGGNNNTMNMNNNKQVSFDSNIKVIEIDSKVSDGFFYGGSKNLDPFANNTSGN